MSDSVPCRAWTLTPSPPSPRGPRVTGQRIAPCRLKTVSEKGRRRVRSGPRPAVRSATTCRGDRSTSMSVNSAVTLGVAVRAIDLGARRRDREEGAVKPRLLSGSPSSGASSSARPGWVCDGGSIAATPPTGVASGPGSNPSGAVGIADSDAVVVRRPISCPGRKGPEDPDGRVVAGAAGCRSP